MFSNEEKNKISIKEMSKIESDMMSDINKSASEHLNETKDDKTKINENTSFNENEKINSSVSIPKEVPRFILGISNGFMYEKRVQSLPKDYQERAREVIKPTQKQVDLFGQLIEWFTDRYAPMIFESPYTVPITIMSQVVYIEFVKMQTFKKVEDMAQNGGE